MSKSTQYKISKVRKPRVHITYDVHVGDAIEKKEVPYVIGVLANLSGLQSEDMPNISRRKFVNIDSDNFDDILRLSVAQISYSVKNTMDTNADEMPVDLKFTSMKDFEPLNILKQIAPMRSLYESLTKMHYIMVKMENSALLKDIIKLITEDSDLRSKFKKIIADKKAGIQSTAENTRDAKQDLEASIDKLVKLRIKEVEDKILKSGGTYYDDADIKKGYANGVKTTLDGGVVNTAASEKPASSAAAQGSTNPTDSMTKNTAGSADKSSATASSSNSAPNEGASGATSVPSSVSNATDSGTKDSTEPKMPENTDKK